MDNELYFNVKDIVLKNMRILKTLLSYFPRVSRGAVCPRRTTRRRSRDERHYFLLQSEWQINVNAFHKFVAVYKFHMKKSPLARSTATERH